MKVKICGITRLEDGLAAVQAGADMLGFNFYAGSPRYLEISSCQEISAAVRSANPAVKLVGVFVNAAPQVIAHTLDACGLDFAQLTGEDSSVSLAAQALGLRAFPALRLAALAGTPAERAILPEPLPVAAIDLSDRPAVIIDAHLPGLYGGTGQLADWDLAAKIAERFPVLLAGGLTPENVRAAILRVKPWGVDVASGVEITPGIKDHDKVRHFVHAAKTDH